MRIKHEIEKLNRLVTKASTGPFKQDGETQEVRDLKVKIMSSAVLGI